MKEDWNSVPKEQRAALEQTMKKMEQASQPETWFAGNKVNDVLFCEDFLVGHPMKCIHGRFFGVRNTTMGIIWICAGIVELIIALIRRSKEKSK